MFCFDCKGKNNYLQFFSAFGLHIVKLFFAKIKLFFEMPQKIRMFAETFSRHQYGKLHRIGS